ncbi:MAG: MATE family efflux transporter [Christensenellaceae bacterium]|jgi:putative MATE family efflux protein|nr:MATE family efflux transporter [Christensenellaceae bacterium]
MAANDKVELLANGEVKRLVIRLSIPTIIIMLVSALYNAADTFFVSRLGTEQTAAVGIAFSYMAIVQALGFFFGHGSGNFISRAMGAGKKEEAENMAVTALVLAFSTGVVLMVIGLTFKSQLARLFGATDTILPYAVQYLQYVFIGTPFILSSFTLNNQLRFQGQAGSAMVGMLSGALLNIGLDPLFIYVFNMGITGASVATMISQIVGFAALVTISFRKGTIKYNFRNVLFKKFYFLNIAKGGLPSLIRQSIASVAVICLNHEAGLFGDSAIAAFTVSNRILMLVVSAVLGLGQGFQPVCGFNYGAKKYARVKQAFFFALILSVGVLTVLAAIMAVFAPQIVGLFTENDTEVIRIGAMALRFQCITLPLSGLIVLVNMLLQTIGRTLGASLLALSRQGIFLIPLIYIFSRTVGLEGLIYAVPVADAFAFALALFLGIKEIARITALGKAVPVAENENIDVPPPPVIYSED